MNVAGTGCRRRPEAGLAVAASGGSFAASFVARVPGPPASRLHTAWSSSGSADELTGCHDNPTALLGFDPSQRCSGPRVVACCHALQPACRFRRRLASDVFLGRGINRPMQYKFHRPITSNRVRLPGVPAGPAVPRRHIRTIGSRPLLPWALPLPGFWTPIGARERGTSPVSPPIPGRSARTRVRVGRPIRS